MAKVIFTSLTRTAELGSPIFAALPRDEWADGDYVVAEVLPHEGASYLVELRDGRMSESSPGDLLVGALGRRAATLSLVGDWRETGPDMTMDSLTSAGLFGKTTSRHGDLPARLRYGGHVLLDGAKTNMADHARYAEGPPPALPTVVLIGSSMSAGKTTAGRAVIRALKSRGARVIAVKLTGAGRYRDILAMGDAGADHILDFVDAGLPSTVCDEDVYRRAARRLLAQVARLDGDVLVVEIGASPLEPYNGAAAFDELPDGPRCTILCASDPYAVVGVIDAFEIQPDVVTGLTASTTTGRDLVRELTGLPVLNVIDPGHAAALDEVVARSLALDVVRLT